MLLQFHRSKPFPNALKEAACAALTHFKKGSKNGTSRLAKQRAYPANLFLDWTLGSNVTALFRSCHDECS